LRDFQRLDTEKHYFGSLERAPLRAPETLLKQAFIRAVAHPKSSAVAGIYSRCCVPEILLRQAFKALLSQTSFALLRTLKTLLR